MALVLSRGIIVLGIYIYTVSVTTADTECYDLVLKCISKFQHMNESPLCGELKDAINCVNTLDIERCIFNAVNHTQATETNQSNQQVNSNLETEQSHSESYQSSEIHQSKLENDGNDATIKTNTLHLDSGSHSRSDGTVYGNSASQSDQIMHDYKRTLIDITEIAKAEYNMKCNVRNAVRSCGHHNSILSSMGITLKIGSSMISVDSNECSQQVNGSNLANHSDNTESLTSRVTRADKFNYGWDENCRKNDLTTPCVCGTSVSPITWSAVIFLIGVFATVDM